ncbi:MAG: Mur ligase family protein [Parachlamydiales bacterium]
MKRALIVGMGVSGKAARELLLRKGYEVVGVDDREPYSVDPDAFDEVIVSPGVPPTHPLYVPTAIGEMTLACRYLNGRALAITGTNGKTTVTLLVEHILNSCGIPALACGNVGTPLSAVVDDLGGRVAVVELSSYQLETMSRPVFDAGVILNIREDHLDRYRTQEAYAAAKLRLQWLVRGDFYGPGGLTADLLEGILPEAYKGIDRSNAQAAYLLCKTYGVTPAAFVAALATYKRPPHRREWVAEVGGVTFINDSKGTTPDAVVAAVELLEGPIWLIAGGQNKGLSFKEWASFAGKVERLLLIGEAAREIGEAVGGVLEVEQCGTLERAVDRCREAKGTVLLSPGCASFDQFADYRVRGEAFRELVGRLQ